MHFKPCSEMHLVFFCLICAGKKMEPTEKKFKTAIEEATMKLLESIHKEETKEFLFVTVCWIYGEEPNSATMTQWVLPSCKPDGPFSNDIQPLVDDLYNQDLKKNLLEWDLNSSNSDEDLNEESQSPSKETWNGFEVGPLLQFEMEEGKRKNKNLFFEYVLQKCCNGRLLTQDSKIQCSSLRRVNIFCVHM